MFCIFYGFSVLRKHKKGNTSGKESMFFHCFLVFLMFFGFLLDVGNDIYMQEGICACEGKNACFWIFHWFCTFDGFSFYGNIK